MPPESKDKLKNPDDRQRPDQVESGRSGPLEKAASRDTEWFHVVAIGASAGGLEALENLFVHMPADTGAAFVIVQHLAPERESYMPELLAKKAEMKVVEAAQDMRLEPGIIYVKTPGKMLSISGGAFELIDPEEGKNDRHLPIDRFFRDLAADQAEKAIGIILSGAGSDGSEGLRAIHRAGGAIFVQDPAQAGQKGMPRSAIETGLADFVLPVEKMPRELVAYLKHPALRRKPGRSFDEVDRDLPKILRGLRNWTGQDFSQYKKSTVRRRVQRRMAVQHIESVAEYATYLQRNTDEADVLFRDLLINVTSFFRDPQAFDELKKALATRLDEIDDEQEIRIWSPGCATGEEAFSLAIILCELLDERHIFPQARIFATDLNEKAIDFARKGLYPENIAGDLDEERLEKFFEKKGGQYKVNSRLREMVVFAIHNLTSAPPFSRLDLVSCRNLLIYLDAPLQKKVLPLLHYSLKPGGLLFLGTSEDIGDYTTLFAALHNKFKIFRARKADSETILRDVGLPVSFGRGEKIEQEKVDREHRSLEQASGTPEDEEKASAQNGRSTEGPPTLTRTAADMRSLVERSIMERYAPPGVLIDAENRVRYFHNDTGRYLSPPRGNPSFRIEAMATGDYQHQIIEVLEQARREKQRVMRSEVPVGPFEESPVIDLVATPLIAHDAPHELVLLTFEEKPGDKKGPRTDARVAGLERELHSVRQDLQATIEELESSNEELQSANEELQANNEELQSANEELETSREELQSTNEELEVVNNELEEKNTELIRAKDDVNNLFNATGEGTLILDSDMKIQRYTPAMLVPTLG